MERHSNAVGIDIGGKDMDRGWVQYSHGSSYGVEARANDFAIFDGS